MKRDSDTSGQPEAPDHRKSPSDPAGVGARAIAGARRHRGRPIFDWIDGLLISVGGGALVVVLLSLSSVVPALHEAPQWVTRACAAIFVFGPVVVRHARYPHTLNRAGVPRDGLGYRLLSILGLLLMPIALVCLMNGVSGIMSAGIMGEESSDLRPIGFALTGVLMLMLSVLLLRIRYDRSAAAVS